MSTRASHEMQIVHPISGCEWDYASIGTLSDALQSRKISASELLEHTIARIEALDGRLNPALYAEDCWHVNRDGYRALNDKVRPLLRDLTSRRK